MSDLEKAARLTLEAMGLIGADLVCDAAHHKKADRHGIGEPCPIQARWHHAFSALRQALEQPASKPWVGLTPEEVKEISLANRPYVVDMVVALEQRLKEKNT